MDAVCDVREDSMIYFVTSVPLTGHDQLHVMNYNKNLLYAVRKVRRDRSPKPIKTVGLHHWCLQQKKSWDTLEDLTEQDKHMLMFLILSEVD